MKQIFNRRTLLYVLGIMILACGITMNTKTNLGVSPVISVAFNFSKIVGTMIGVTTFIYYAILILIQLLLMPGAFRLSDCLQLICAALTSLFIQIFDFLLPIPETWVMRFILLVIAITLTGIGASITVGMKLVPNPADGLANIIGKKLGKDLGFGKNVLDAICIILASAIALIFKRSLLGIGIGTVVSVIFTGRVIALFHPVTNKLLTWTQK